MFACACPPPQDSFLQVPPSGGTPCVSHRHTYPLNPPPCHGGALHPPPPVLWAMGCNRNRPDINTTTVGGRGGTGGLCIPVVIAPSRRATRGGGVSEMDIRDPPWAQANFPPPKWLSTEYLRTNAIAVLFWSDWRTRALGCLFSEEYGEAMLRRLLMRSREVGNA